VTAATIAVDLGGSGSRILVRMNGRTDRISGEGWSRAQGALGRLEQLVTTVAGDRGIDRLDAVTAGLTGLNGTVPNIEDLGQVLRRRLRISRLIVADDSVTWAYGALGDQPGVLLAIGTGTVTLAKGPTGRLAHVDGNGPYLGDRGSGWWIGRQGLIAALAAVDRRSGGSAILLTAAENRYGDLTKLPETLRRTTNPHADIATFASDIAAAARQGEPVAMEIFRRAGVHLGTAIAAAARGVDLPSDPRVALVGGVAQSADLLTAGIEATLGDQGLTARYIRPGGDALDGAMRLLSAPLPEASPLLRVWQAEA
jgi:glucosamine kinase